MSDYSTFQPTDFDFDFWPITQLDPALYQKPTNNLNITDNTPRTVQTSFDPNLDDFGPADHDFDKSLLTTTAMTRLASHPTWTGHYSLPASSQPRQLNNGHGKREFHHVDMEFSRSYTYGSTTTSLPTHHDHHVDNVQTFEPADYCSKLSSDAVLKKQRVDDNGHDEIQFSHRQVHPTSLVPPSASASISSIHLALPTASFTPNSGGGVMSRECSLTSASSATTADAVDIMMRVESSSIPSTPFHYPVESSFVACSSQMVEKQPSSSLSTIGVVEDEGVDHHHLLGSIDYGFGDAKFPFSAPVIFSGQDENLQSDGMSRRSSCDSVSSSALMEVKASERRRKHIANAKQSIAPKCPPKRLPTAATTTKRDKSTKKAHTTATTTSTRTTTSKPKQLISKTPYIRPTHAKLYCKQCKEFPSGFRGEHELRRHHDRAHASKRKVWICVDPAISSTATTALQSHGDDTIRPLKPLSSCKQCIHRKSYNVYYNAAAHLRRAHFCPRKRGRRAKGETSEVRERRAGKAGGDWPKIEWLKENGWLMEIEIDGTGAKGDEEEAEEEVEDEEEKQEQAPLTALISSALSPPSATLPQDQDHAILDTMPLANSAATSFYAAQAFFGSSSGIETDYRCQNYLNATYTALQVMQWPTAAASITHPSAPMMQHTISAPASFQSQQNGEEFEWLW